MEEVINDVERFLRQHFNLRKKKVNDLDKITEKIVKHNILNCELNENCLKENELNIIVFEIIRDNKSISYFNRFKNKEVFDDRDNLLVIFEEKTGYIETESNQLFLELLKCKK